MAHCCKCGCKIKYKKVGCRLCGKKHDKNENETPGYTGPLMTQAELARSLKEMSDNLQERLKVVAMPTTHTRKAAS